MKKILLIIFVFAQIKVYSQGQKLKDNFNYIVRTEEGDLNKDGLIDKVVVTMDTVNNTEPLRLQIFFLQPNGKYLLNVSTEKLIAPQYPNGKYCGNQIPDIEIENGCLNVISEIKDNHFMHKFKFRNGHFELINISNVISDGNSITNESEFDLLKGIKTEKTGGSYSGKPLKKTIKKIRVRPLPQIDDFRISDSRLH